MLRLHPEKVLATVVLPVYDSSVRRGTIRKFFSAMEYCDDWVRRDWISTTRVRLLHITRKYRCLPVRQRGEKGDETIIVKELRQGSQEHEICFNDVATNLAWGNNDIKIRLIVDYVKKHGIFPKKTLGGINVAGFISRLVGGKIKLTDEQIIILRGIPIGVLRRYRSTKTKLEAILYGIGSIPDRKFDSTFPKIMDDIDD